MSVTALLASTVGAVTLYGGFGGSTYVDGFMFVGGDGSGGGGKMLIRDRNGGAPPLESEIRGQPSSIFKTTTPPQHTLTNVPLGGDVLQDGGHMVRVPVTVEMPPLDVVLCRRCRCCGRRRYRRPTRRRPRGPTSRRSGACWSEEGFGGMVGKIEARRRGYRHCQVLVGVCQGARVDVQQRGAGGEESLCSVACI